MRKEKWVWLLAGLITTGLSTGAAAQQGTGQPQGPYMEENVENTIQYGPGYDREGQAEDEDLQADAATGYDGMEGESDEPQVFSAGERVENRPPAPGGDYVWVDSYRLPGGRWVAGFWRPRLKVGFEWVNGLWDVNLSAYVPGYWRPVKFSRPNYVWAPGYWYYGRWVPGLWRPITRSGFVWINGHWTRTGEWVNGHWRPTRVLRNRIWVPGYWGPRGIYYPGYWRSHSRKGFIWVPSHHNHRGDHIRGHWREQGQGYGRGRGRGLGRGGDDRPRNRR